MAARGIYLVGFSGTGKSTVAQLVAERLGWLDHDLDRLIVERSGMEIPEIFRREGEAGFRLRESEALRAVSGAPPFVVATGGGAALRDENRRHMASTGWTIALEARPEALYARIERQLSRSEQDAVRPLLDAASPLDHLRALKGSRQPVYALADWTVHTDRLTPQQVADEVVRAVRLLEQTDDPPAGFDAPVAPPSPPPAVDQSQRTAALDPAEGGSVGPGSDVEAPVPGGTQAFTGFRVLELTNVLAGPFCAYQLAMLGAEVVKIELPGSGDLARQLGADEQLNARGMGTSFLAQNAGKKSVTIDLATEQGRRVFLRLVETADVVVENFRPGVMKRLGISYDELRKVNPAIVYCAISGFGQEGPLKDAPAYDQIVQGMSGMMSISGDTGSAPLRVGYPIADTIGGITAAFAIASALVRRLRNGQGAFIDVSMLDSTIVTMGWVVSNYLIAEHTPRPMGNENSTAAPSGTFRTGDGLLNIAANKQEQFEALVRLLGLDHLATDARFAERAARKVNRAALTALIEPALIRRSAEDWEVLLAGAGVPAGRVLTVPQALRLPQIESRRLLKTFERVPGVGRPVTLALAGFKVAGADPDVATPPPSLGQHTEEILREAGYDAAAIEQLRKAGAI